VRSEAAKLGDHVVEDPLCREEPILQLFACERLREDIIEIGKPFDDLARLMVAILPCNPERSAGLRKLLEARDCAVRAWLYRDQAGV
jgi:hypothetical protein